MLGEKGGANQALERLPSLPVENFNLPQEYRVAQHACVLHASGPLGRGTGKIGSNCSSFKDGFGAMIQSVNHSIKKKSADKVFSGWFRNHCGPSKPLNLFARK